MRNEHLWFSYAGVDSRSMAVHVLNMPDMQIAEERGTATKIPGRDGSLWLSDNAYNEVELKIQIEIPATRIVDGYGMRAMDAVKSWLTGTGELVLGIDPQFCIDARVSKKGAIKWGSYLRGYYRAEVTFTCVPFKRLSNEEALTFDEGGTFAGRGTIAAEPIIHISGTEDTASLMINGSTVLVDDLDGEIIIDCDAKFAYRVEDGELVNCNPQLTILSDDSNGWIRLKPDGETNTISWTGDGVETVEIEPRWRWR